ncbi:ABC transporter substrate-binding protein [Deinococcus deserti]|uniref:Putative amino acid ABC transporter, periplasmic component n=1 Tax=Deinococcus deserti (strain DSM 17065 / CIP 109153 / LMG 22923 / VCD115) TaxID=546414 RepID=C1D0K9_DEIDV|nr:ABC transporter substrate-binding protein [Deinococcus deserti]ACO45383.2 putative amino acid ABC transporter, periplasmic component [Deinococcus deserti VCD115]
MRRTAVFPFLLAALIGSHSEARTLAEIRNSGTLRIATSADFAPYSFMQAGMFTGFDIDLGNELALRMGLHVEWVTLPYDGLLGKLNTSDEVDVVFATASTTQSQNVVASVPYGCTNTVLLTRKGGPTSQKALSGKTLGAEEGRPYLAYLKKMPFQKIVQVYPSSTDAILAAATGRVAAVATDQHAALSAMKTYPKAGLVIGETLAREQLVLAVGRKNTALRDALNAALKDMQREGSINALGQSYFGRKISC